MVKKILFIAFLFPMAINATYYLPSAITLQQVQKKPKQIAWDIHDTLTRKDGVSKFKAVMGNIFTIGWTKITPNAAWDEINRLPKNKDISGQGYATIFQKHGEHTLAKMVAQSANAYKPRKGMLQLVQKINAAGVTQRFASNIGETFLQNLNTKFKTKYHNHMLDLILPGKVIDYSQYSKTPLKIVPAHLTPSIKPDPSFFADFNKTYNPTNSKLTIFIDDKMENIQQALKAGWIGIHVDANKDDEQIVKRLQTEFQELGIFDKK